MLLSPIGSPTKTLAHLRLPPLVHDVDVDIVVFRVGAVDDVEQEDTPIEPELRLPIELVLLIADYAAQTSRRAALSLCLVSTWMREAILPTLYTTVILHADSPNDARSPFRADDDQVDRQPLSPSTTVRKPLADPLVYVQHLWADVPQEFAPRNLDAFPNLQQLAIHVDASEAVCNALRWAPTQDCCPGYESHVCKLANYPPCRSLTVLGQSHPQRWTAFTSCAQGRAFLQQLTHLRLLNICLSHYIPLEYIPSLTHLCIPFFDLRPAHGEEFIGLDYILAQPHLKMVVLTLNPRYWRFEDMSLKAWACLAMARDERLYVVASTRVDATRDWDDPRRDWEAEVTGGVSIWEKAVQVRRKFLTRLSRSVQWDCLQ
ncbi:hypothetical protein SCHPADRAFT_821346 [Schizopora paradoxa]|uniref:Uncharacterized protein n=1 Tax=Schizopora paradoxa TaxID=27342 RepID=A0A0H2S0I5_9AGAM|nr:hypothetical protein SCHPADRAFT_821346 [Schizopora paradoxa]